MGVMASHITSLTIVYSTAYSGADQRKHQSSASLAYAHKWPVKRKMFSFDDIIMSQTACNAESVSMSWGHPVGKSHQNKQVGSFCCYRQVLFVYFFELTLRVYVHSKTWPVRQSSLDLHSGCYRRDCNEFAESRILHVDRGCIRIHCTLESA